jgi:hypothetical protein
MLRGGISAAVGLLLVIPRAVSATADEAALSLADRDQLAVYARDTWRSLDALAGAGALPPDSISRTEVGWKAAEYTSPTNVAAYLWSTIAAEDLKIITPEEATRRIGATLVTLGRMDRSNGFFYSWYDPRTGDRLHAWPGGGGAIRPFLSSVDNGWLAVALMMVANHRPEVRPTALALLSPMNFQFFYDPYDAADPIAHPGLLRGGYFPEDKAFATFHYGTLNTEPRIASYVGIARGQLPPDHYFRMTRSAPLASAAAPTRKYLDVPVVEGSSAYRGIRFVPSWDGTMFEALMVPLFVPEALWAGESWGKNHPRYVQGQIEAGLKDQGLGTWGMSASSDPDGGYAPYGVPQLGSSQTSRVPSSVVTPHATFLALPFAPRQAMDNLRLLATTYPIYGDYGFLDSVDVHKKTVSKHILTLDQGMVLASIANALAGNAIQKTFCSQSVEAVIRPLIALERFALDPESLAIRSPSPSATLNDRPQPAPPVETLPAITTGVLAAPPRRKRGREPGGASRTSRRAPSGASPPPDRRPGPGPRRSGRGSRPRGANSG